MPPYLVLTPPDEPIPRSESELRYYSKAMLRRLDSELRAAYAQDAARLCTICDQPLGHGVQLMPSDTKGELDHLACTWMRDARKKKHARPVLFE